MDTTNMMDKMLGKNKKENKTDKLSTGSVGSSEMINKMLGKSKTENTDKKLTTDKVDVIGKVSAAGVMNKILGKDCECEKEEKEEKEDSED